ncbi:hypothetical protein J6590_009758 [Homalodisca vitripennis]|nr:hypothetical protein J6590_009758 [Homalodisca vitripennis]
MTFLDVLLCFTENSFSGINFVPEPTKSSLQFLEETIGPASSCNNVSLSPDQQQCYQPSQLHWLPEPRRPKYMHEPMPSFFQTVSPHFHFGSMVFDGGGDRSHFNPSNSFLPPIEEDSPVFQYFPRRMF